MYSFTVNINSADNINENLLKKPARFEFLDQVEINVADERKERQNQTDPTENISNLAY